MTAAASPCRTYIVYHHGLFAEGVRSMLEARRAVQIVGMEGDVAKALKAVRSLQPEVIIVEESTGEHQPMCLGAFLNCAIGGRVVTLSLDHSFATVYDRRRVAATDPTDLVEAIRGPRPSKQRKAAGSQANAGGASMADRPESGSKAIQTEATGPYSEAATDGAKKEAGWQ
jgi:DNA-binding NarL/FixJ family response regulator